MRLQPGTHAPDFALPAVDGTTFRTDAMRGRRYLLAFFRFASCPFCNLRVRELTLARPQLPADFGVVAVFASPIDSLRSQAKRHDLWFPVLSDEPGNSYAAYGVERSAAGVVRGMLLRAPTLMHGIARGYLPVASHGAFTVMPADLLVDERGVIAHAHYGADEGDHLPLHEIVRFANTGPG